MPIHLGPWIRNIRQDTGRAEEYVVFDDCAGIDRNVILNFDIVLKSVCLNSDCTMIISNRD